ncbi:MAG: hypothetical protein M3285_00815 [Actinomycetota bacterium]|nr:hypothetical protein [Actinomycetota bacterium]
MSRFALIRILAVAAGALLGALLALRIHLLQPDAGACSDTVTRGRFQHLMCVVPGPNLWWLVVGALLVAGSVFFLSRDTGRE